MKHVTCVESESGSYELADYNDERLFCIAQMLINDHLRTAILTALDATLDVGLERHLDLETKQFSLKLSPLTDTKLAITLTEKEEPYRVYETDILLASLLDLIDEWEEAVDGEATSIKITREQDTFELEAQYI
jgi:hypothetical protein